MPMPGNVAKGNILKDIDKASTQLSRRDRIIDKLHNTTDTLVQIGTDSQVNVIDKVKKYHFKNQNKDKTEEQHLDEDWFRDWWKQQLLQPIHPILRRGLRKAFDLSKNNSHKKDLPIDCYWVCAGTTFEVVIGQNDRQVTVLILSPPPEDSVDNVAYNELEDIWIAKKAPASSNPWEDPDEADEGDGVVVVRLKNHKR